MCGIIGCYPKSGKNTISKNIHKIKHRGPDDDAVVYTSNGVLGHVRLSIIDVDNGQQPMSDQDSWIAFNGEIYNFLELRNQVNTSFETQSDTEVVLSLYRQFGPGCVSLLDGMFAFAIADGESLFLARDPLGIKPLYYAQDGETLYFASEIKALYEISADVQEFPAGHWWHSELGMKQYYQLSTTTIYPRKFIELTTQAALPQIRQKLETAVEKRMIADNEVPVGVSLSGGLDSSLVAAIARQGRTQLDTFVVGITGGEDIPHSESVAKFLGTNHHIYQYTLEEMIAALPEVIYHLESFDAPLIRSAIPNYFLAKLAAEHVKVILTGEGADEIFGGYEYLHGLNNSEIFQRELVTITNGLHNTNLQRADRMSMAHGLEARVPFLDQNFVDFSLSLPATWKMHNSQRPEKKILRDACQGLIPEAVLQRPKSKFSDGAGSINLLAEYANRQISDAEFEQQRALSENDFLRSKEELYYYQIFHGIFGDRIASKAVGRTRSITKTELQ